VIVFDARLMDPESDSVICANFHLRPKAHLSLRLRLSLPHPNPSPKQISWSCFINNRAWPNMFNVSTVTPSSFPNGVSILPGHERDTETAVMRALTEAQSERDDRGHPL